MNTQQPTHVSRFLSLVLRHKPEAIHLTLNHEGWASTHELLEKVNKHGIQLSLDELKELVDINPKKRFAFSDDGLYIRASQGHSIGVNLGLQPTTPPTVLLHGTAWQNLDSIREKGLLKQRRDHVHLSANEETARNVGTRYGQPVVLTIRALDMHRDGHSFYLSANGVWLTDHVPASYIES